MAPAPTIRIDRDALRDSLRRARTARPAVGREAVGVLVGEWVKVVRQVSPMDTRRYVRGWVLAGRDLGLDVGPVPPLQRSDWAVNRLEWLEEQLRQEEKNLAYWQGLDDTYKARSRGRGVIQRGDQRGKPKADPLRQPYYRNTVLPSLRIAQARTARARTEWEKFTGNTDGTALVIFRKNRGPRSRSVRFTVRDKVYGGSGRWVEAGGRLFAELVNREPHARIVEKRHGRPVATANAAVRAFGLRRASRAYLERMRQTSGLSGGRVGGRAA